MFGYSVLRRVSSGCILLLLILVFNVMLELCKEGYLLVALSLLSVLVSNAMLLFRLFIEWNLVFAHIFSW